MAGVGLAGSERQSEESELKISYVTTILAGILLACFLDVLYQGRFRPGRLIYSVYHLFSGPYRSLWYIHLTMLLSPLLVVNGVNFFLYHRSQFRFERVFFLILSTVLNGLVFFVTANILVFYFL